MKENVEVLKEGLNSEEKIFATVVNLEKIYKKYKLIIWVVVVAVIAYFIATAITEAAEKERIENANSAYAILLNDKSNSEAQSKLKEASPSLFDLYRFNEAMKSSDIKVLKELSSSKAFAIADMSKYQYAMLSGDHDALLAYINDGGLYYRDIALLNAASTFMKQTKLDDAKELLNQVKSNSPFYNQAQMLMHFGITK